MIANLFGAAGLPAELVDLEPQHGLDFCDQCSDCLVCHREDPCRPDGDHSWVIYPEFADGFRQRFGLEAS